MENRNNKLQITLTTSQKQDIYDLLWDSLPDASPGTDRAERVNTGWGTKTEQGLANCILAIINNP